MQQIPVAGTRVDPGEFALSMLAQIIIIITHSTALVFGEWKRF